MNLLISIFAGLLFFVLSPNVLLRLPKNGSKFTVAGVHAAVFTVILFLFQSVIFRTFGLREGQAGMEMTEAKCTEQGMGFDAINKKCIEPFTNETCTEGDMDTGTFMQNENGECVKRP